MRLLSTSCTGPYLNRGVRTKKNNSIKKPILYKYWSFRIFLFFIPQLFITKDEIYNVYNVNDCRSIVGNI